MDSYPKLHTQPALESQLNCSRHRKEVYTTVTHRIACRPGSAYQKRPWLIKSVKNDIACSNTCISGVLDCSKVQYQTAVNLANYVLQMSGKADPVYFYPRSSGITKRTFGICYLLVCLVCFRVDNTRHMGIVSLKK